MDRRVIFFLIVVFSISMTSAITSNLHVNIQFKDGSGNVQTGTFTCQFNITTDAGCSNILYTNTAVLTSDAGGVISYYIPNVNLPFNETYYLCVYKNGVLDSSNQIAVTPYSERAKNVTTSGIIVDSNLNLNSSGKNITASSGIFNNIFGFLDWSYITNIPNLIKGLWTTNNANNLLISNGTAIGYNESVLNSSIINVVNTMGLSAGNASWNESRANDLYVNVAGDVMQGNLTINGSQINLDNNATIGRTGVGTTIHISETGNIITRFGT